LDAPGERIKLGLLCLLLLLMLGIVCSTAVGTYRAVRSFQQQNNALETGDVSTIRSWMTIHVVAHLYRVPEDYLSHTLSVSNPDVLRHSTLNQLASKKKQPVNRLIQTLQHAILDYRKTHHALSLSSPLRPSRHGSKTSHAVKTVPKPVLHSDTKSYSSTIGRPDY